MANNLAFVKYLLMFASGVTLMGLGHALVMASPAATTSVPEKTVAAAAGLTLTSTSVELPSSERAFPDGPGVEAMQANCAGCHSAGMVLNQPALSRTAWEAEVNKMRAVYKAPVAVQDVPAIVDYLASTKGAK